METHCYLVKVFLLCFLLPGMLARVQYEAERPFQRFPPRHRFQHRRFETLTSRLTSRPLFRSRVRPPPRLLQRSRISNPAPQGPVRQGQDAFASKWFRPSPRLSEVSVPSIRRTPIPKRGTLRQLNGDLQRESIPVIGLNNKLQRNRPNLRGFRQKLVSLSQTNSDNVDKNNFESSQSVRRRTPNVPRIVKLPVYPLVRHQPIVVTRPTLRPSRPRLVLPLRKMSMPSQVLPKVVSRQQRISPFQDKALVRQVPYQTKNLPVPSQPLVSLRPLPKIQKSRIDAIQTNLMPAKPIRGPLLNISTSDSDSTYISLQTQVSSKSYPLPNLHKQPNLADQRTSRIAELQTVPGTIVNQGQMSVIQSNPSTTLVQTKPLVRPIQTNPDYTIATSQHNQITQSSPGVTLLNQIPVTGVVQTNPGTHIGTVQPIETNRVYTIAARNNDQITGINPAVTLVNQPPVTGVAQTKQGVHTGIIQPSVQIAAVQEPMSPGTIPDITSGSTIQAGAASPVDTLHSDLVEAFTNVIESLLVPQISGGQTAVAGESLANSNIHNALGTPPPAISNAHVPQQNFQGYPHTPGVNQFAPHHMQGSPMMANPYNQFRYMQSLGYMNPWMSSAALQEMMYGDTTDPPDIITTTVAPNNVSMTNSSTINVTATTVVSNATLYVANQENVGIEFTGATDLPIPQDIATEIIVKAKDVTMNIASSLDLNNDISHQSKIIDEKPTVMVTKHTGSKMNLENANIKSQKANEDPGLVSVNAKIELKPASVIETKPTTDAKIDLKPNVDVLNADKIKSSKGKVISNTKGTIEALSKSANIAEKKLLGIITNTDVLNTDLNIDNNAKLIEKGGSDPTIKSSLPKVKNDIKLKTKRKKTKHNTVVKDKKMVQHTRTLTKIDKKVDKNEKLILDIASLIRSSKLDIGKLSNIVSGKSGKVEKVNMEPIPERYPTAKQLGIKLTPPVKKKRKKNKVRPTKSVLRYTKTPKENPTVPPVPKPVVENNITIPTLIPKGLVFTRQPEIYRTLRTMLKHNPDAVKKAITTDPTPTNGFTKAAKGPGIKSLVDNPQDGSSPALVSILTKLTKTSTVKATEPTSEVPVLANVDDHKIEQKLIVEETSTTKTVETVNEEKSTGDAGNALHKQLSDLKLTKDDSGIANYLNDPDFVNLLKGILKNMASKPEVTTSGYYYHEPETTPFYPEFTTTSEPPTTTEEYEAEDYITEAP